MSTYSAYDSQISQKIANPSETFYDSATKVQAVNDTIKEILKEYDIPEFIKVSTITFAATGIASKPTDYVRMIKLWDSDDNEYLFLQPADFDYLADAASYYWTEDYVAGTGIRLFIRPLDGGTLNIRYIIPAIDVESTGATDSGLSSTWDEVVVYGTAMRLFQMSNRWDEAREFERLYRKILADTYMSVKNTGGIKQNNRIRSRYERMKYFS